VRRRWPPALWRMARRDLRRHARRSALVVALVALPVAGLTAGIVLLRAAAVSGEQRAAAVLGTASFRVDAGPGVALDPATLPPGSRTVSFAATDGLVRVGPGDARPLPLTDQPLDDPLTAGMLRLRAGRAPAGPGEVAVSIRLLRELGRRIGDTVRLERPARILHITGTVLSPADVDARLAVTGRGGLGPAARRVWLVGLPPGAAAGRGALAGPGPLAGAEGLSVTTRERAARAPAGPRRGGVLNLVPVIAGLALLIAALVAAAAFAAGVRREVRDLGLLAAAGASPGQLRAAVLARGATLGLSGGVAGLALGVLAAATIHPSLDRIVGHLPRPFAVPILPLLGAAAAAVLAGTAAALFPARFAARVPPVAALAARAPAGPPPRRVSRLGIAAVVVGCAVTGTGALPRVVDVSDGLGIGLALAGLAILLGGFVACSTALVAAVEPLAPRLPLAGRMATRQAARNRSRAGPAVAAITVALAIPVLVSSVLLTTRADDRARWRPTLADDQLQIQRIGRESRQPPEAAVRAVLAAVPGSVAAPLRLALAPTGEANPGKQAAPGGGGGRGGQAPADGTVRSPADLIPVDVFPRALVLQSEEPGGLFVGDGDLLAVLGAKGATAELAAGRVVGVGRGTVDGDQVALHHGDFRDGRAGAVRDPEARVVPAVQVGGRVVLATIRYAVGSAEARRLGLVAEPQGTLVRAPHAVTAAELRAARAALAAYPDLTVEAGPGTPPRSVPASSLVLMFGVSAAVALAAVAAMVGLAQAEAGPERRALSAVGASPSVLRRTAAAGAGLLALLGGLLAIPAGLLPLAAIYAASPAGVPLVVPWAGLGVGTVLVPLLAAAGAAALTRTGRPAGGLRTRLS
jgi:putative ABC transport system permease protein